MIHILYIYTNIHIYKYIMSTSVSGDSVLVSWLPPDQPNGRLLAYR